MAEEDYYALLGVGRNATDEEVKRAYLRLAASCTPIATPGRPLRRRPTRSASSLSTGPTKP